MLVDLLADTASTLDDRPGGSKSALKTPVPKLHLRNHLHFRFFSLVGCNSRKHNLPVIPVLRLQVLLCGDNITLKT